MNGFEKKKLEILFGSAFEYDHDTPIAYICIHDEQQRNNKEKTKNNIQYSNA